MKKQYPEAIITAFLTHYKGVDIIQAAGISKGKYYNLLSDQDFQKVLQERRDEITRTSIQQMQAHFSHNLSVLQEIIDSAEEKSQVKVNALQLYFGQYARWKELQELTDRIKAIEEDCMR